MSNGVQEWSEYYKQLIDLQGQLTRFILSSSTGYWCAISLQMLLKARPAVLPGDSHGAPAT